ncbi:MAG: P22 coat protein [Clostridia bacterium]|nr:P22 coat protein [Clostridia bacterium]
MSNMISVKQIARETLPKLIDNLVFPNLVYRDCGEAAAARQGDSVLIRRPVKFEAEAFSSEDGVTTRPIVEEAAEVKLDTLATVDAAISAWDAYDDETIRRVFIEPAAAALAEKINRDGLNLYRDVYQTIGEAGTAPDGLDDLAKASLALDLAKVPTDRRAAVWSPLCTAGLKQIPAVVNAEKCGDTTALRTGAIGKVFGVDHFMSQAVCRHTAGTLAGTSLTVKAAVENSDTCVLAGSSLTGKTLVKGDILTVGEKSYTVLEDTVASASEVTVKVAPAMTAGAGTTVTVAGSHEANLVFHPHAFAFVTRPLSAPAGVESYVTTYNGISLRVVRGYDIRYKREMLSMDVLYGFKAVYPELAVRYMA